MEEVSKKYATIEEDLKDMSVNKSKKTQKAKNTEKKTDTKVKDEEQHPAAGAFTMDDSESDDESDDESDNESDNESSE